MSYYKDFDKKIENPIIVLSHLQDLKILNKKPSNNIYKDKKEYFSSYDMIKSKAKKDTSKEEIEKEVEKEIMSKKENLKEESLKLYYKINNSKNKELEEAFKESELKVISNDSINLGNGKMYSKLDNNICIISDIKNNNKLYEIKLKNLEDVKTVIELDNNDLIFLIEIQNEKVSCLYNYELLIYRLKNKIYSLHQNIKENRNGYVLETACHCCQISPKNYQVNWIKKLSGNRFMIFSNYGIKIYSLNKKKQYSLVLMDEHLMV